MDTLTAPPMTVEEFLLWEEQQEGRWEFDGERPVEVNGGTWAHHLIVINTAVALRSRLDRGRFEVFAPGMMVRLGRRIRCPDVLVVPQTRALTSKVEHAPLVVFEVLSPGTRHKDGGVKLGEYQAAGTIRRYVMLEQTKIALTVFAKGAGDDWTRDLVTAPDAMLAMPEIGVELPVAEIYDRVIAAD